MEVFEGSDDEDELVVVVDEGEEEDEGALLGCVDDDEEEDVVGVDDGCVRVDGRCVVAGAAILAGTENMR